MRKLREIVLKEEYETLMPNPWKKDEPTEIYKNPSYSEAHRLIKKHGDLRMLIHKNAEGPHYFWDANSMGLHHHVLEHLKLKPSDYPHKVLVDHTYIYNEGHEIHPEVMDHPYIKYSFPNHRIMK